MPEPTLPAASVRPSASAASPARLLLMALLAGATALAMLSGAASRMQAQGGCAAAVNPVVCENQLPGDPTSAWDVTGSGDSSIQGFATEISVVRGQTQRFKIDTDSNNYTIAIYRMGYYSGFGARRVATISPSAPLPQLQPGCLTDPATGLVDCGNWNVSASWTVPADAVSGVYFARPERVDNGGASHIFFIVRDDTGQSDVLFQTADTTWQAYNSYGGNSFYQGGPGVSPNRAYKVSYNRPLNTRAASPEDAVFNAEYPMVRWLEKNGFDVSYIAGADTDRAAAELLEHKVFLSVGHDEYWTGTQRANVEAARGAGVHLGFFSGNAMYWKARWEPSSDGAATPYRTLVSYKETHANGVIDPATPTWTGTWRDPRFSPPADGGRPENALMGTIFRVNDGNTTSITVPAADGKMRFWRNTSVATLAVGGVATLPNGTLGYEWDEAPTNAFTPPGLMRLSTTTRNVTSMLLDYGSTYGAGTATHSLTVYRDPSGALVFGAGTIQWSWGLDANHDRGSTAADARMKQATVNLFADMGVQPDTLEAGLTPATESTDVTAPTSVITAPAAGASVPAGTSITISGTASDAGGGMVGGVQVSVNGGATWSPAIGGTNWTFSWTASGVGAVSIRSRAFDDSGNLETPSAGVGITVTAGQTCPCTIWTPASVPPIADDGDAAAVEVGTRFRADTNGFITGIRFYKAAANTGTHTGRLWTNTGTLLATVTFSGETASGWQQATLASAVPVTANTTYVVSYHAPNGHYTGTDGFFATSALDNPPLHGLLEGVDGSNGVYRYGAGGVFPTDTYLSEGYWADVVFNTVPPPDSITPTITSVFPVTGSGNVDPATIVTAAFSEAMDPATISSSTTGFVGEGGASLGTFELRDPLNSLVNATVTYDTTTRVATLRPDNALALSTTYTVLVKGGATDPRVKDLAGNALAANSTWTFTTAAAPPPPPACPCTIWTPTTVPQKIDDGDPNSVELGTRFRSDVAGYITGARFYKGSLNTGTHIAKLWTNAGALLGSATFTGETASGWQEVAFTTPIAIAANTTYMISYHALNGHYSSQPGYFATTGVDNGPLHALRDGVDGANGVYQYGASAFPAQTWQSEGYFVDVVFNTTNGPDTTKPVVTSVAPVAGLSGIGTTTNVLATFNESMSAATITSGTVLLRDPLNALVTATVTYNTSTRTATLDPAAPLAYLTTYTATVKGGATDPRVKDVAGNALAADYTWSFTTAAPPPPPPTQGPGGPVLVITSASNPFSTYLAEILRSEGLNAFATADLSTVNAGTLTSYDVVVLGEMPLSAGQVTMFTDWVTQGGNLVAMRPDKQLAGLMGLTDAASTLANAYLLVNTTAAPGAGIVNQTIQFHGTADRYTLSGATAVATLYATANTATANPAVTMRTVGAGHAVAFTYDLARSIVYTRQGNPAWSGQERDGLPPIRSDDLFFGAATGDLQPDWVDFSKIAIPQADEQQRLLWNILLHTNSAKRPLPRFWYFPRMLKAVVIMTGDDHANGGTAGRFDQYLALSAPGCSVADWTCIRGTSYLFPTTPINAAQVSNYVAQGFELGVHVNTQCADYTPATLASFYSTQLAQFAAAFPSVPPQASHRTHCIAYSDYATQPQVSLDHGIRLDTNYYYWPATWVLDRPGMFTGSGLPMRFATAAGDMVDVYQAATQMTDESGLSYAYHADTLFDRALGVEGYYGAFTANMHTDFNPSEGATGSDAIIASAQARGVPVIAAKQMLDWLDGRNGSSFESITWGNNLLDFDIAVGANATGLHTLIPAVAAGAPIQGLTLAGVSVPFTLQTIKGVSYAVFPAQSGSYQASYGVDAIPPVISAVSATPSVSTATVQWATNEASDSQVDYGTSPAALSQTATNAAPVTSHSLPLANLQAGTVYYYRVRSADTAGNTATSPVAANPPASFTTLAPSLAIADATIAEGQSGTSTAAFTITLSAPSSQPVSVAYATANGTASAGSDYTAAAGTVTLSAGTTSVVLNVTVTGDTVYEPGETFVVNLSAPANATLGDAQATGTITNDDPQPSLAITDATVAEGNAGTAPATLAVTLSAASSQTITLSYATANATAAAGSDYVAASGTLTFAPGVTSQPIALSVSGDTADEADETFVVSLSAPANATIADAEGAVTITDDDAAPSITIADASVTEGHSGTSIAAFTLTLSAASGQAVSVGYATADGTASAGSDYVAAAGTASFAIGATTTTITVVINGDTGLELNESFVVNLSGAGNATIADSQATGTILNDEGLPAMSIGDAAVTEGDSGSTNATLTVSLSEAGTQTITVSYATANGSATAGSDYVAASGVVTFLPGETSQPITIAVTADAVDEPNEAFVINLGTPVNATMADAQGNVAITDDDPTPSLAITDPSVAEGNAGTATAVFAVSMSGASSSTVTVAYATANGTAGAGADYVAASGTVTFLPGEVATPITVSVIGDTLNEANESFVVNLSAPVNATLADVQGGGTITDDDPAPTITIADLSISEGNSGTKLASFTLTLSAASGQAVTVAYATANGTASAGSDYVAATGTATFAAGATTATVNVTLNGDSLYEANETFVIDLSLPVNATLARTQATGTITNDDSLPAISITDVAVAEGQSGTTAATLSVTLSAMSAQTVTVAYATADGTATAGTDYTAASGTLTFLPGVLSQPIAVTVTGETAVESSETILVNLSLPANATIADAQGIATITNDDGTFVPGLVAAYGFNEGSGTTAADASGAGQTGSISGATWSTAGKNGNALSFDGVNDLVTVADTAALDVTRTTLMAWLRPSSLGSWRSVVLKETTNGLAYALYANDNASRPAGFVNLGSTDRSANGTATMPLNAWTHVAMTYDGANIRLYVNGVLVRTRAYAGNIITSARALTIGGNSIWGEWFAGLIDDVRIYNRALTLAEVQTGMNTPVTP
ncbi:MAG: Calx-beta domain-containing protein [Vicinamibacterales bacterium]|jgi:hypothetical protein